MQFGYSHLPHVFTPNYCSFATCHSFSLNTSLHFSLSAAHSTMNVLELVKIFVLILVLSCPIKCQNKRKKAQRDNQVVTYKAKCECCATDLLRVSLCEGNENVLRLKARRLGSVVFYVSRKCL